MKRETREHAKCHNFQSFSITKFPPSPFLAPRQTPFPIQPDIVFAFITRFHASSGRKKGECKEFMSKPFTRPNGDLRVVVSLIMAFRTRHTFYHVKKASKQRICRRFEHFGFIIDRSEGSRWLRDSLLLSDSISQHTKKGVKRRTRRVVCWKIIKSKTFRWPQQGLGVDKSRGARIVKVEGRGMLELEPISAHQSRRSVIMSNCLIFICLEERGIPLMASVHFIILLSRSRFMMCFAFAFVSCFVSHRRCCISRHSVSFNDHLQSSDGIGLFFLLSLSVSSPPPFPVVIVSVILVKKQKPDSERARARRGNGIAKRNAKNLWFLGKAEAMSGWARR